MFAHADRPASAYHRVGNLASLIGGKEKPARHEDVPDICGFGVKNLEQFERAMDEDTLYKVIFIHDGYWKPVKSAYGQKYGKGDNSHKP
ncbi:hypothetical protein QJS10_CPA16g00723 [Acorus calamus]|uniref:Uncharacterized protein n=1 Tax=Acorus calamus TaxID=4465 RepID=A0AAV9D048_ACOCL|nr:hypothetical protein QJS10_CPA16g00723 [Acorus calamus]